MKPLILVPPAQAEALSDTQDELRCGDFGPRQPWRDDDGTDELLPEILPRQRKERAASNAQLWPSSANSSR